MCTRNFLCSMKKLSSLSSTTLGTPDTFISFDYTAAILIFCMYLNNTRNKIMFETGKFIDRYNWINLVLPIHKLFVVQNNLYWRIISIFCIFIYPKIVTIRSIFCHFHNCIFDMVYIWIC